MSNVNLPIGKSIRIRDCGYDEIWLQDQIVATPAVLQLGDLEVIARERQQASGGRLDILLKDPEDDGMYEVEIMLGETDETHIVRTIEYWSRERRKWPRRQHTAVLVAETITRRFFDVVQVLSEAIPLIAVQAAVVEANGARILTFTKILDAYEEPEENDALTLELHDEAYWLDGSGWVNDAAEVMLGIVKPVFPMAELNWLKNYIAIVVGGNNYFWFHRRAAPRSLLGCWVDERSIGAVRALLESKAIAFTVRKNQRLLIPIDKSILEEHAETFRRLAETVKEAWS